jgi:hypothetical protein
MIDSFVTQVPWLHYPINLQQLWLTVLLRNSEPATTCWFASDNLGSLLASALGSPLACPSEPRANLAGSLGVRFLLGWVRSVLYHWGWPQILPRTEEFWARVIDIKPCTKFQCNSCTHCGKKVRKTLWTDRQTDRQV